jgi:hypothetical protein
LPERAAPLPLDLDQGPARKISSVLEETIIGGMPVKHGAEGADKFVLDRSIFWMKDGDTMAGGSECVGWQDVTTTLFGLRISGPNRTDTKQATGFRAG